MPQPPTAGANNPGDIGQVLEAERAGVPFVLLRTAEGRQVIHPLDRSVERVVVGRRETCDIVVDWDERVSRTHAELVAAGDDWAVADDGLSRNGTFVNGQRISGRRRLADRDVIRVGSTAMMFRQPAAGESQVTSGPEEPVLLGPITDAQRRVLVALCRPCIGAQGAVTPATNEDIARELSLTVEAVKGHLRVLFRKFAVGDLPQNQKRMRLVQLALESGVVGPADVIG